MILMKLISTESYTLPAKIQKIMRPKDAKDISHLR